MVNLNDKLLEIKKKTSFNSKFIHSTYVWNYNLINPNSKGYDLTNNKNLLNKTLNNIFKNNSFIKSLNSNFDYIKLNNLDKQNIKNTGIMFPIDNAWHSKIKMPKDNNGNYYSWLDYERRTENIPNSASVFEKIIKNIDNYIEPTNLKKDIIHKSEVIAAGNKNTSFCYGKVVFRNQNTKAFEPLGINIILLGPGSKYAYSGDNYNDNNEYDLYISLRYKYTYGELTERLIEYCEKLKINYHVEIYNAKDGYQDLINYKPMFIHNTILKYNKQYPILYTDADMYINQYPEIFDQTYFDCILYNWNTNIIDNSVDYLKRDIICYNNFEIMTSGGTMWWNSTPQSLTALKIWDMISENNPGKADDRILGLVFSSTKTLLNLKCYWLPSEFIYLTDKLNSSGVHQKHKQDYTNNPIIIHPEDITSEEMAGLMGASKTSRYPPNFFYSKSRAPDNDILSDKFRCFKNSYTIKKNVEQPFVFFEEDENLIFQDLTISNSKQLLQSIRPRYKKLQELLLIEHKEYDFNFMNNFNNSFKNNISNNISNIEYLTRQNSKCYIILYTNKTTEFNKNVKKFKNLKKHTNNEYSIILIKFKNNVINPVTQSLMIGYKYLNKSLHKNNQTIILPLPMYSFNEKTELFKIDSDSPYHMLEYKIHMFHLNIILMDETNDFFAVNYNALINKNKNCIDQRVLNIVPFSVFGLKYNKNCMYFVYKCIEEFNNLNNNVNDSTEWRIIDNVFNRNMLAKYFRFEWLPEDYIIDMIYCEDYYCEAYNLDEYYKFKIDGKTKELNDWDLIQKNNKNCYKTYIGSSVIYTKYAKMYPDFMKIDDPKLKVGEKPKNIIKINQSIYNKQQNKK